MLLQLSKRVLEIQDVVDTLTDSAEDLDDEIIEKYKNTDFNLNDILDKMIKLGGFDKLSEDEKKFLRNENN